jgi:hypothetical protein
MIRQLSELSGPQAVATLVYGAIASAVTCGGLVGVIAVWLSGAVHGGE